jgi:Protein of unknown function (DUF4240)
MLSAVDFDQFWAVIEGARRDAGDPADAKRVAGQAVASLSARSAEEIIAAEQRLGELLAGSYQVSLWAAASVIQGGCSDDGFEYFRGWLILQGRRVFEAALADPDSLASLPAVHAVAASPVFTLLECENALYIASEAYEAVVGRPLPEDLDLADYPDLDGALDFTVDDRAGLQRRLPRLVALCWPDPGSGHPALRRTCPC